MFLFLLLQKRPLAFVLDLIEVIKKMLPSLVNFIVCRTQERCYLFIYFIIFGLMLIKRHALSFFFRGLQWSCGAIRVYSYISNVKDRVEGKLFRINSGSHSCSRAAIF